MSELRRERRKEREQAETPVNWGRRVRYALLIVAAFGVVYYLGTRHQHKYDAFAKCLTDRGVKMYGAWWCPHCQEQKAKFGATSFKLAPYVECGVQGDTSVRTQVCKDEGIQHYPTWQFPPTGERVERVFELEDLSERTGCALP
jgi:hypothetical protein